jgi:hypothetical protein
MVTVFPAMTTVGPAGATTTLLMSRKSGTASVTMTLFASAFPLLVMISVKTIVSPMEAVVGSPDLVTAGSMTVAAPVEVLVGVSDAVGVSVGVFDQNQRIVGVLGCFVRCR